MMTGPGTNTYLVGRRDPILIDTGAGVPDYVPLLERYLAERGFMQPSRVLLTHRHRDHLGGVASLRARFKGLRVSKMRHKDAELTERIETIPAIVARIYIDVAPALHPVAALSVESHLKKLAREGRVREETQRDRPSRWTILR